MMYQSQGYSNNNLFFNGWTIASLILALVGGILTLVMFLKKSNREKYNKKLKLLFDFLNFDLLSLEYVIKFMYAAVTIFVVLNSFNYISFSFVTFLMYLIFGVIFTRVMFEMLMLAIKICNNTTEIKDKLNDTEKETKKK